MKIYKKRRGFFRFSHKAPLPQAAAALLSAQADESYKPISVIGALR